MKLGDWVWEDAVTPDVEKGFMHVYEWATYRHVRVPAYKQDGGSLHWLCLAS